MVRQIQQTVRHPINRKGDSTKEMNEKCYYQSCIQGRNKDGDTKGELEWCTLSDNPCLLMTGDTCEEYNSQREE